MSFGPILVILVFTQFSFTDDPGSKCGKISADSTQVLLELLKMTTMIVSRNTTSFPTFSPPTPLPP